MMDEVAFNVTFDTKEVISGKSLHKINCADITDNQAHKKRDKINQKSSTNPTTSGTSYEKHAKHKRAVIDDMTVNRQKIHRTRSAISTISKIDMTRSVMVI